MSQTGIDARRSAIYALDQILGEQKLLSEVMAAGAFDRLDPADRARAQRLVTQTLRGLERADRLLQKHLQKNPPLTVRNALRLGTVELCHGEAAHGVVNALVDIVSRHKRFGKLKGLVNAVLRKIAGQGVDSWNALRAPRLPKWLRVPLANAWGAEAMGAMEIAHFAGAPLDVSLRMQDTAEWAAKLGGTVLPTGSIRLKDAGQVSKLPGFDEGAWWIQDAAAALPVKLLGDVTGKSVLDLCAAPGGKTLQLAAAGAQVTAVDASKARMARVEENLKRTNLRAETRVADAFTVEGAWDAILLDAPCSATGTIRRHPDLPHAKDGSEFGALIEMQAKMLDHALTLLKPGGHLIFCTCSLLPDEGEVQVQEALARHPNLRVAAPEAWPDGVDPAWVTEEGGLRLRPDYWPDLGGMDGFYMARLTKA